MTQLLRKRLNRKDEEGFTLIELMVVVLIIAILLAIAIPTFLGARSRAQNRAAESNLRNALTAEKTGFTDNQVYEVASVVQSVEPALSFVTVAPTKGSNQVEVTLLGVTSGNSVCLLGTSSSGNTYGILDVAQTDATFQASGTYYGGPSSGTQPACPTAVSTAGAVTGTGTWASTPSGAGW